MANRIARTSQYLSGYGILTKAPKNKTSFRTISIPEDMVAFLSEYLAWWAVEKLKMGDLWKKEIEITDIKKNTKKFGIIAFLFIWTALRFFRTASPSGQRDS